LFFEQKIKLLGLITAKYKFTDWLDLQLRASLDRTDENTEEKMYEDSYELSGNGNVYNLYDGNRRASNMDFLLSFRTDLSERFHLIGFVGGSVQDTKYESVRTVANGLIKLDYFFMGNARNPITTNGYGRSPQVQSLYAAAS